MAPVIVVGAGLAGLHAAWRLGRAGVDVVVLEARERVGGRTWSHRLADGTVVERGGEFIAPGDDALRGLCAGLGLELVPHGFPFDRRPTPDQPAPTAQELGRIMAAARSRIAGRQADAAASEVLAAERSPAAVSVARRLETSLTVPLTRVSARRLFGGEDHGYDPADRVRAGNQRVALELARRLGDKVRLGSPVVAIRHDASAASVRCRDGGQLEATAVVIAVPLPLLLVLELDPGLPLAVTSAAERALFGDAAKLHVPLARARDQDASARPRRSGGAGPRARRRVQMPRPSCRRSPAVPRPLRASARPTDRGHGPRRPSRCGRRWSRRGLRSSPTGGPSRGPAVLTSPTASGLPTPTMRPGRGRAVASSWPASTPPVPAPAA